MLHVTCNIFATCQLLRDTFISMFIAERFVALAAPHECLVCGSEGSLLCSLCGYEALDVVPERCYRCLAKTKDSAMCHKCRPHSSLKYVWVTTEYDSVAKELVRIFKFERASAAYVPVAEQMAETLPYLKPETVITYIPTATSRQRMRGYDQSKLLAKRLAKIKNVRFMPLLERHGQSRQVGATKKQRFEQAAEMFRLHAKEPLKETEVIIVDDIVTTGASLEAAAKLLKQNGIKQVSAAVFAQKH